MLFSSFCCTSLDNSLSALCSDAGLRLARRQADEKRHIVGLHLRLVRRTVTDDSAAPVTALNHDEPLFRVGGGTDWTEHAVAGIRPVPGENIHVQGAKAERTVIAGGVPEGQNLASAVHADESVVLFLKSFGFHNIPFCKVFFTFRRKNERKYPVRSLR